MILTLEKRISILFPGSQARWVHSHAGRRRPGSRLTRWMQESKRAPSLSVSRVIVRARRAATGPSTAPHRSPHSSRHVKRLDTHCMIELRMAVRLYLYASSIIPDLNGAHLRMLRAMICWGHERECAGNMGHPGTGRATLIRASR